jgi:hypothetical protein
MPFRRIEGDAVPMWIGFTRCRSLCHEVVLLQAGYRIAITEAETETFRTAM